MVPTEQKKYGFDIVTALIVFLIFGTFTGCYWYTAQLENMTKEVKEKLYVKQMEYEQQKKGIEDIEPLRKKVTELRDNITFYEQTGAEYFGELSSLLPNNMKVNDISVNYQPFQKQNTCILTLSGSATEKEGITPKESVSKFITSIKKSEYFKDATITNLAKEKITKAKNNKDYSWNIKIEFPVKD